MFQMTYEIRLTVEPCSIRELLATKVERWQPQGQAQQVTLSLQPLPELPLLNLDPLRMSQAFRFGSWPHY
jgi:signal transduction histidine kinase